MPYQNGFELLKLFDKVNFDVIFTTAYEQYALKAIKFNALDYLLKPFGISDLQDALQKYSARKAVKNEQPGVVAPLEMFLQNMKTMQHSIRK
ncbi:response regulator [Chitinophaga sedimenti]|uniref:LytR/AlgR family response regulator transcription factor n=1 Tax=Chitinophaga sedimenti TaxID=2033606 RepID=UPI002003A27F|nr:response regulator [Chitinophaga sedimenti]MCK7557074.1 response regulator [Chitinophaga sedimenti]